MPGVNQARDTDGKSAVGTYTPMDTNKLPLNMGIDMTSSAR
jgi:hypothetical protein